MENIVCGRPTRFETKEEAQKANDEYNKIRITRNPISDEPCLLCGKWHLGTEVRSKELQDIFDRFNLGN